MPTILEAWLAEQSAERPPWDHVPISDDARPKRQPVDAVTASSMVPSTHAPMARMLKMRAFLLALLQAPHSEQRSGASASKDAAHRSSGTSL